jgi:hypothetical protein
MRRNEFIGVRKQYGIGMADDRFLEPGCGEEGYEGENSALTPVVRSGGLLYSINTSTEALGVKNPSYSHIGRECKRPVVRMLPLIGRLSTMVDFPTCRVTGSHA